MTISADGGKPEKLTVPDRSKDEYAHGLPHYLPDGKSILFTIKSHPWDLRPRVAVLDLAAREWRTLVEDGADARFVPSGHLAFLRRGTLMAAPVDRKRLDLTGQPVPVVANVGQALNTTNSLDDTAAGQFDISNSGFLIYAPGGIFPPSENSLVWVDHTGQVEPVVSSKAPFFAARLSPDGRRIAYSLVDMEYQVWIYDLVRGTATRLTSEGLAEWALWTPDGGRLILDWLKTGVPNLHQRSPDGALPMERLTESEQFQFPGSISPDGETLAFLELDAVNGYDIKFLNMRDRRITPFLNSRFTEMYPEISPDGRWIAYTTDESGRKEVYVQPFRGQGRKWQISHEGGVSPLWAPDGRRLFYRSPGLEEKVWVVDVGAGPDFSAGKPRFLIELPGYVQGSPVRTWDISRDGKRFLAAKLGGSGRYQPFTELILVQNWFQELKRLAREGR
jgi:serine/threonine-protein kinase